MENTKRDLSLDFTKPRHTRSVQPAPSLVMPILALSTPELNKMISGEELAVLTPNGISSVIPQSNGMGPVLPSPLIPTAVNSNNIIHTNYNNNNHSLRRTQQHIQNHQQQQSQNHHQLHQDNNDKSNGKDLDIEKIEKKRERNRLAAKKCRQRKLETIDELRKTVSDWEKKYEHLEEEFKHFKTLRNKEIEQLTIENSKLKGLIRQ